MGFKFRGKRCFAYDFWGAQRPGIWGRVSKSVMANQSWPHTIGYFPILHIFLEDAFRFIIGCSALLPWPSPISGNLKGTGLLEFSENDTLALNRN